MPVCQTTAADARDDRDKSNAEALRRTLIAGQPTHHLTSVATNPVLPELPALSTPTTPMTPPATPAATPPVAPSAGYHDLPLPEGYSDYADVPTALLAPLSEMGRSDAEAWMKREYAAMHMARAKELLE